jgi:hypothetical protein
MSQQIDTIIEELKKREPAFHQVELCSTRELLEEYAASDFWEVGASGQVYSRELILDTVEKRFQENTEADTSKWKKDEFKCRELSENTFIITYLLNQEGRITRRMSIWQNNNNKWQIVYHQGTIVSEAK